VIIGLAAQVEHWLGPMTGEPGFQAALARHISRGTALIATAEARNEPLGCLFFTAKPPAYYVRWLVVAEHARRTGIGGALMGDAIRRFVTGPGIVEVVTFGADHRAPRPAAPAPSTSGSAHPSPGGGAGARRRIPPDLPQSHHLSDIIPDVSLPRRAAGSRR
jgi:GNAT superfamily N-acetyltransferase